MMSEHRAEPHEDEQSQIEEQIGAALDLPMALLSLVMLVLIIVRETVRLSPDTSRFIVLAITIIWWLFIIEYVLRLFLAYDKLQFFKRRWFETLIIFIPVLRVFRIARAVRSFKVLVGARGFIALRRGFHGIASVLGRRGFSYVLATTALVVLVGSLGMYVMERDAPRTTIRTLGDAVWWTAGTITTIGTELYPVTAEGRALAVILMIYGVGVAGYVAGALASYFVKLDRQSSGDGSPDSDTSSH